MKLRPLAFLLTALVTAAANVPRSGDELRFCLHGAPKTLDPLQASDSPGETVRYLTSGTLLRQDRRTQQLTPELASSWKVLAANRQIEFTLRETARFSDGSPVTPEDVIFTLQKAVDPALHSPIGDMLRAGTAPAVARKTGPRTVLFTFPKPMADIAGLFDGFPILSARNPSLFAGPYVVASYRAGSELVLQRNAHYWKKDAHGAPLPRIGSLRIRIQPNREMELMDFERGDIDLIPELTPELAERVASRNRAALVNMGLTLDALVAWVNQVPNAPLPPHKKAWFQATAFRRALSLAINRDDLCRIAYLGKAQPGVGPISPANRAWFNTALKADPHNPAEALNQLRSAGFVFKDGSLYDNRGNRVEFSLATNAGNKVHERIAGLLQQDWKQIGIRVNIVTLDFPSLIERITRSYNYEAAMLPLTNIGLEPEDQTNIWVSSSANHQWNPSQPSPATPWEKEIDAQMAILGSSVKPADRKRAFDRVQAIVREQSPFIYLAHPQAQGAVSGRLQLAGAPIWPYLLWGLENASLQH